MVSHFHYPRFVGPGITVTWPGVALVTGQDIRDKERVSCLPPCSGQAVRHGDWARITRVDYNTERKVYKIIF